MTFLKFHLCLSHLVQLLLFRICSSIVFCGGGNIYVHPLGVDILFWLFPPSGVPLGFSSYPIFTKFGMQVYWVNSLYGIAFGDDSCIAN